MGARTRDFQKRRQRKIARNKARRREVHRRERRARVSQGTIDWVDLMQGPKRSLAKRAASVVRHAFRRMFLRQSRGDR